MKRLKEMNKMMMALLQQKMMLIPIYPQVNMTTFILKFFSRKMPTDLEKEIKRNLWKTS
jgi:hypothetical protein